MFVFLTKLHYFIIMIDKRTILNFRVDDELLKRLDDYRFDNRIKTMSEAIRRLIEDALVRYEKMAKK